MTRLTKNPESRLQTRPTTFKSARPLEGYVAVVAGATRGAGRGIARAMGEAGATVYCTGRSVRGNLSPYGRPETLDETADIINAAGGTAIPVRVDHTVESEVEALFRRVDGEHGRLDVLVSSIAGEEPMMGQWGSFWKVDFTKADAILRQSLVSHIITAKYAAPIMIRERRGLIVEVTENDILLAGGNPLSQVVKLGLKGFALNMATELRPHGVAAIAITPGFLRSESMLEHKGLTEANWRDGGKKDKNFLESESSGGPWPRSPRIRRFSTDRVSCSVRGNSVGSTTSPTTTAAAPTGEGWRSISPSCLHPLGTCSEPARSFSSNG